MIRKLPILLFLLIYAISPAQIITTIAGDGINGFSGDGGPATIAEISGSGGNTLFDNYGNIYFDDQNNSRVRKINTGGIITTIAGNGIVGFYGNGGPATAAEFNQNTVVAFDSSRNMYVVDFGNNQIRIINTSGTISAFAGTGAVGYSGNGGPATAAKLDWPCCAITDDTGNVYIADSWNNVIRKVSTSGIITLYAGNGVAGYSGDGGNATLAEMNKPFRMFFDKHWNLYVADAFNSRIREINTAGIITTFAGTGVQGYGGDGGPASAAQLNEPYGVCIDTSGNVYIADSYNNRIRVVNTSGIISTYAGNGIASYSGDGGPATAAEIDFPTGVNCNKCGIYISDWDNHRLRMVTLTYPISVSHDTSICSGDSIQLIASGVSTYKWSPSAGLSCTTCANPVASPTVTTTYSVSCGCSTSEIKVTVNSRPVISLSGQDTVCSGSSATLSASGGTNYLWSNGATTSSITNILYSNTTYTIQVSNGSCFKDTTIKVEVTPSPIVSLSGNNILCAGDSTTLTASGGMSYLWSNGATTSNITVKPSGTITYTLAVSNGICTKDTSIKVTVNPSPNIIISGNNAIICYGDSSTLAVSGGGTYLWSTGSTSSSIVVKPASNSTYTVTVTTDNCSKDTTITVAVSTLAVGISSPVTICYGDTATLTSSGGGIYHWSTGATTSTISVVPASTTTYTATITNGACVKDTTVKVTVNPLPMAAITGKNKICTGNPEILTASGGTSYLWMPSLQTTDTISVNPASAVTYTVIITNSYGCKRDTSITVTPVSPNGTISGPNSLCSGDSVKLTVSGSGTYKWSTGATANTVTVYPSSTTTYKAIVNNGCPDTLTTVVTVLPTPVLYACCDTTITSPGKSVTLTSSGAVNYSWSPSTGLSCINCPNPTATPTITTTYTVIGSDSAGCSVERLVTVVVSECIELKIPNVFTPNSGGINSLFVIDAQNVSGYSIHIYDRWGKEMYHSSNPADYWNGENQNNNSLVTDGVYYYIVQYTCSGKSYNTDGFVQVIR
jgi:gliding motility-associated-like protein